MYTLNGWWCLTTGGAKVAVYMVLLLLDLRVLFYLHQNLPMCALLIWSPQGLTI